MYIIGMLDLHIEVMATGGGSQLAEREEEVLGHAVEHALGIEAGAFRVVVTTGGRQTQIEGLRGGHGRRGKGESVDSPQGMGGAERFRCWTLRG